MTLEERIDSLTGGWQTTKKRMFSGYGYMVNGNLAFGTHNQDQLIVRAGEEKAEELLKKPGIRIFDITGRPMKNWFVAVSEAVKTDKELQGLLTSGYDFAKSLPPKRKP